jgi:leucyl/phenylalanyl-tRNA--protein transferase
MPWDRGFFPPAEEVIPDARGLVCTGGELSPEILIESYAKGIFPWTGKKPIPWYSPDPRLLLEPQAFVCSRSLRATLRRRQFTVRFDDDFRTVMLACASSHGRTWITRNMHITYGQLHDMGVAHCVSCYADGQLCGGLYGLAIGRAFFGESMFHHQTNASKVALWALCQQLAAHDYAFIDCQQETSHLLSLGAQSVPRSLFLERLALARAAPLGFGSWADWATELRWPE